MTFQTIKDKNAEKKNFNVNINRHLSKNDEKTEKNREKIVCF